MSPGAALHLLGAAALLGGLALWWHFGLAVALGAPEWLCF
jgi:hypothetical protein